MPGRAPEVVAVSALAAIVTAVIAAPVLLAPSERVFGLAIVGRHHDPFTAMAQFGRPVTGMYSQPVTDIAGALLARISGPVTAYNWVVLLSFPLSAVAAYVLARHLGLTPAGATVGAIAYAFSPFHIAHAAYHPHIAQTQWVPLYLLALWRCLDKASAGAVGVLGMATVGVTLSNFYGGLIAAVMTPVAVAAYWYSHARMKKGATRHLMVTITALGLLAVAGLGYVWWKARLVLVDPAVFAFLPGDAFRYSAKWWAYLVPPVAHPLLGDVARRIWDAAGAHEALLELQVSLGWSVVALGLFAAYCWLARDRRTAAMWSVPLLAAVAIAALLCSLSPERTIGGFRFVRPSALLHGLVPMFRAYARFAVVVQLMAALLAGIGVDCLRQRVTKRAQIACLALLALAAGEYAVSPFSLWRDALPTMSHRWVMRLAGRPRVLDCTPLTQESGSIPWLTGYRVALLAASFDDCMEPNLSQKLAAAGYTHLLMRRDAEVRSFTASRPPAGLTVAAQFDDGQVFAVTAPTPVIYTATMTGFFPREHDGTWTWRWMNKDAAWRIVNTDTQPIVASLDVELSAFHHARRLEVILDGRHVDTLAVEPLRRVHSIGPLTVKPGAHELVFHASEAPFVSGDAIDNGERRPLSFALGAWSWGAPGATE